MSDCDKQLKPSGFNETICTSDISCYDGIAMQCVTIPAGANLNQVLAAIDQAICDVETLASAPVTVDAADVTYSGDTVFSCFTITGTDVESVIEELATEICNNSDAIANLCADDISLACAVTLDFTCLASAGLDPDPDPSNQFEFDQWVIDTLCSILGTYTFAGGGGMASSAFVMSASTIREYTAGLSAPETFYSSYVRKGGDQTSSPAALSVTISDTTGATDDNYFVVNGWYNESPSQVLALTATSDNYVDVDSNGTFAVTAVGVGAPAPAIAAGSMRLWKLETDGTGVVSVSDLRNFYSLDGSTLADDSIMTRHIVDGDVTNVKLDDIVTGATEGDANFFNITFNDKGRVTASSSMIDITGLTNGDLLQYNSGTGNWENTPIGTLPVSGSTNDTIRWNGAAWVTDSFLSSTGASVGVGSLGAVPQRALTMSGDFGFQLSIPTGLGAAAGGGGGLTANTYYYVVTAWDGTPAAGETLASSEVSQAVDGAATTAITLTWDETPLARKYFLYKGTASGVYTERFELEAPTYFDDGTAGVGGVTPPASNVDGYGVAFSNNGLGVGVSEQTDNTISVHNIDSSKINSLVIDQKAYYDAGAPSDYYGAKIAIDVANTADDNIALFVTATGGSNANWALKAGADFNGDGCVNFSDFVVWNGVGVSGEDVLTTFTGAGLNGVAMQSDEDGTIGVIAFNDDSSGTDARVIMSAGSTDGAGGTLGESIHIGYYSSTYERDPAATTGIGFYQNKGVVLSGEDTAGMVISTDNGDMHFELGTASKMLIESGGSIGIGIDDAGATAVNASALVEMNSTTKGMLIMRMTAAQASAIAGVNGLMLYVTDTDATFSSIGFWGYEGGAWVKL